MRCENIDQELFRKYIDLGSGTVEGALELLGYRHVMQVDESMIEKALLLSVAANRRAAITYLNETDNLTNLLNLIEQGGPMTAESLVREHLVYETYYTKVCKEYRDMGFDVMEGLYEIINEKYNSCPIAGPQRVAECLYTTLTIPTSSPEILILIPALLYMADANNYRDELKQYMNFWLPIRSA